MRKQQQIDLEDYIGGKRSDDRIDARGRELPDPTPIAPPIGYKRAPSLAEQIREMVRSERLAQEAAAMGYETFEEADDFDVGDLDPTSPYENDFDPPVSELRRREMAANEAAAAAGGNPPQPPTSPSQGVKPAGGGASGGLDGPE